MLRTKHTRTPAQTKNGELYTEFDYLPKARWDAFAAGFKLHEVQGASLPPAGHVCIESEPTHDEHWQRMSAFS